MLKVYNTLTRKKEPFKPRKDKKVQMFVCGPTVYDFAHIGHAKTYVQFDIIVKYLRYLGYDVFYVVNITDVDDKIIIRAREQGVTWKELATKFEKAFYEDMKALQMTTVSKYARATDYVPEIQKQVKTLVDKGYAYELDDGIYYEVSKFKDYGKLSGRTILEAEDAVSRLDESIGKRNKGDFCLWKFPKPGDPVWKSDQGEGRPGWHIEDTAITETEFGPQYDIHGGAKELIFPHHEAEIAQMEAASGKKPLVKYWLHTGVLNVDGKKMSKSLGNFITIGEALKKYDAETLRLFYASTHYRSPIDYSEKSVKQAKSNLERIKSAIKLAKKKVDTKKWLKKFEDAMNDDFNTPKVVALLLEMARRMNKTKENLTPAIYKIGKVFGIDFKPKKQKAVSKEIKELIKKREAARKAKNWQEADRLRNELKTKGVIVEDSEKGPIIK